MARPLKDTEKILSERISIRLTKSERKDLDDRANLSKIHPATLARTQYLGNDLEIRVISRVDEELVKEVIRIGININQIQKAINTSLKAGQELNLAAINLSLSNALQELYLIRGAVK